MQSIAYILNTLRNSLAKTQVRGLFERKKRAGIIYKANWHVNGLTND